jgi:hypothetical protein
MNKGYQGLKLIVCLFPIIVLFSACAGDDEPTPAEVCTGACNAQIAGCVQTGAGVKACSVACQTGYTLVPACTVAYRAALDCVGGRAFLTCTDQSITLSVATAQCTDELANYLKCAAGSVVPACLDAPLGNAQCSAVALPPRARLCVGETPIGCQLYQGTMRAGGIGTFCCL